MIEKILLAIIQDLGATGVLVCGLYYVLGKPLYAMAKSLSVINGELGDVVRILTEIKNQEGLKNCGTHNRRAINT